MVRWRAGEEARHHRTRPGPGSTTAVVVVAVATPSREEVDGPRRRASMASGLEVRP